MVALAVVSREAQVIDQNVVACIASVKAKSLELGRLLIRVKQRKMYRALGFRWFQEYVQARGISIGYAERVMRAQRTFASNPKFAGLSVDQILFVNNVSTREESGRTKEEWIDFARNSSQDERAAEKKRLTRSGVLPASTIGREQAIKAAPIDASVDMTIRVSARTRGLFKEQCERWGLSAGGTLLKLLMLAQEQQV